ncbi:rhodanese-like domain-containing protein [Tranquillimonas alkanivorans]|uniref:Rhodanese-related sulfurtransferase n=1 Tax=Tranquillimonas alkanivorans TaxID=441119 RepID=A0A1I5L8G8_9RHOB|nr:rhodanese-like domain-containing protein [Tranquillimonas alkanivorans]SFO93472.1 Rhodanese-related sulfurtransferase [Tranquillimonas alkanivorans]
MSIRPVGEMVDEAKARIRTLPVSEARAMAERGEALLVDIRDIRELDRAGRIPGALHAPRGMLEFWVDPQSPYHKKALATDKTLVLFCASAWRSALAAKTLQEMGLDNVAEIEGGFSQWVAEGGPVER